MKKDLILIIIASLCFIAGVTFLVLSFFDVWKLSLAFALGCTGMANILLFIVNIKKIGKAKK